MIKTAARSALLSCALVFGAAHADQPWTFGNNTRYLSLGDSLAAGYGAMPATNGYAYLLYQEGLFDKTSNTLFANAAVPGATSQDVLDHQVAQVHRFSPHVITVSAGGNDLLAILNGLADPAVAVPQLWLNLNGILCGLRATPQPPRVFIHNLYDVPEITGGTPGSPAFDLLILVNNLIAGAAQACGAQLVDVFSAFQGRTGLLLIERNGAGQFEVHPTNAGYRAMAAAYKAAHQQP